jgi:hypothetical protein
MDACTGYFDSSAMLDPRKADIFLQSSTGWRGQASQAYVDINRAVTSDEHVDVKLLNVER